MPEVINYLIKVIITDIFFVKKHAGLFFADLPFCHIVENIRPFEWNLEQEPEVQAEIEFHSIMLLLYLRGVKAPVFPGGKFDFRLRTQIWSVRREWFSIHRSYILDQGPVSWNL